MDRYVDRLVQGFDAKPFNIAWDCGNGVAGPVVEKLVKLLPGTHHLMFTEVDGVRSPKTSHTLSPVPFAIHDPNYDGDFQLADAAPGPAHGLANVAATVFNLLGYEAPDGYLPSLIDF